MTESCGRLEVAARSDGRARGPACGEERAESGALFRVAAKYFGEFGDLHSPATNPASPAISRLTDPASFRVLEHVAGAVVTDA